MKRHHLLPIKFYSAFGGHLYDYLFVYVKTGAALSELLHAAVCDARKQKCDILLFESLLDAFPLTGGVQHVSMKKIFAARSAEGWRMIYDRKSVRRFEKALSKCGDFHVEVVDGFVTDEVMEVIAAMHIRKWGSSSAFSYNVRRKDEYRVHPQNKHLTIVKVGEEIVALHYGMVFGDVMLWHTPVINLDWLKCSPLRVLLAAEARYCEGHGIVKMDFGQGDEPYKNDFCAEERKTIRFHSVLSIRGAIATMIGYCTQFIHVK